jgi:hypothetical protein
MATGLRATGICLVFQVRARNADMGILQVAFFVPCRAPPHGALSKRMDRTFSDPSRLCSLLLRSWKGAWEIQYQCLLHVLGYHLSLRDGDRRGQNLNMALMARLYMGGHPLCLPTEESCTSIRSLVEVLDCFILFGRKSGHYR